jgi:hypothetical protein
MQRRYALLEKDTLKSRLLSVRLIVEFSAPLCSWPWPPAE